LFLEINVSQGSVTTYARCGEILNSHFIANLRKSLQVKKLKIGQDMTELWPWVCGIAFSVHPLDVAYCYRLTGVVCVLGTLVSPAKWLNRSRCCSEKDSNCDRKTYITLILKTAVYP